VENRAHAIVAVTFLVVLAVGAFAVYAWLANRQHEPLAYEIVTTQSVGGLTEQSEVRFKGLVVGHVARIGFDPADRAQVIIQLRLKAHTYVTHATYAEVAMQGLTGGSVLDLKLGPGSRAPPASSRNHPARIPLRTGPLGELMARAPEVMRDLKDVLAQAHLLLDADNRRHVAASLAQLDTTTRRLAALEQQLPPPLAATQRSVERSHALLADADRLVRTAQAPVHNAVALEASIDALARSTRALSDRLNQRGAPDLDALGQSLTRTSAQLDVLLQQLNAKPQSVLFGPPRRPPGPGEPGFDIPAREPRHP
jgi:phospholipid/cholesterol/gamma-HCH transport system substrate-binding protein